MGRAVIMLNVLSFVATASFAPYVLSSGLAVQVGLMFARPNMAQIVAALVYAPMILPCLCLVLSFGAKRKGSKFAPFIAGFPLALFIIAQINPSTSYF